jgi:uncharacterized protein YqhQ
MLEIKCLIPLEELAQSYLLQMPLPSTEQLLNSTQRTTASQSSDSKISQSKKHSAMETGLSTAIGLVVAFVTQIIVFSWFGIKATFWDNVGLTVVFTAVSLVRGYGVRRLFNWMHTKDIL